MAHRRSKGEGSIYLRPDGLWVAQITLPDGKRKKNYSKVQKDVREWLQTQRNQLRDGVWVEDNTLTVANFFDRFLNDTLKFKLKANTFESYSDIVRLHIKPTIGNIKLVDLRPYHLQELYKKKVDGGLSKRTVQYIHAVIHRGLEQAFKWGSPDYLTLWVRTLKNADGRRFFWRITGKKQPKSAFSAFISVQFFKSVRQLGESLGPSAF